VIWLFVVKNWKWCALGAGILVILFAFRLWLVRHDGKIYQEGRVAATVEMETKKKVEWAAKEKELEKAAEQIDLTRSQIDSEMTVLQRTRNMTRAELQQALATAKAGREVRNETVAAIPDTELDAALRAVSNELAAKR
jgi:hypothetical protein